MKLVFEVHIPYPQTLVYFVEANSPDEAIEIAYTPGVVESHSIGGCIAKPVAYPMPDHKPLGNPQ